MTARMRRLLSDFEQVKKDFAGHKNIIVTPIGTEPPEKYHVTYFVNGIYLLPDGRIETLGRHEVEITLHADYPRYKPICRILTPIWHPNFRDEQICIGDIWGAGESLSDIIVNIGDMIQYKSWNAYSPLSADAAQWAIENKHLFPIGNIELYAADYASAKQTVEIDLFDEEESASNAEVAAPAEPEAADEPTVGLHYGVPAEPEVVDEPTVGMHYGAPVEHFVPETPVPSEPENDFEITAEELAGIEFIPTAQRMQTMSHGALVKGKKLNFKTVLIKGLLWAFIGAFIGFGVSELLKTSLCSNKMAAIVSGNSELAEYFDYSDQADVAYDKLDSEFRKWCKANNWDPEAEGAITAFVMSSNKSEEALDSLEAYLDYNDKAEAALYSAYMYAYNGNNDAVEDAIAATVRTSTAIWSAVIALFIGLFLGIGEGVYYGSAGKAFMYAGIGAGISMGIGLISGYLAQWMYAELLADDPVDFAAALVRGLGWAIMGVGIGVSAGLIKPQGKRILFCTLGGATGAFTGGFLFNYICDIVPGDTVARGVAIVIMGLLIGLGVGLLEQVAKSAWLKVIRGEFEGKEYLVFSGTTSIGNNGRNTIVLFKDKLVGAHHCDITLEGNKYILTDCGTPMGTVVNGQRTARHVLRQGDAIAIGNSVLVFNTK